MGDERIYGGGYITVDREIDSKDEDAIMACINKFDADVEVKIDDDAIWFVGYSSNFNKNELDSLVKTFHDLGYHVDEDHICWFYIHDAGFVSINADEYRARTLPTEVLIAELKRRKVITIE